MNLSLLLNSVGFYQASMHRDRTLLVHFRQVCKHTRYTTKHDNKNHSFLAYIIVCFSWAAKIGIMECIISAKT